MTLLHQNNTQHKGSAADPSQELLNALLKTSADGIALVDNEGTCLRVNEAFGALFGKEARQVVGMTCRELFSFATSQPEPPTPTDRHKGRSLRVEGAEDQGQQAMLQALEQDKELPYVEIEQRVQRRRHRLAVS